MPQVRIALANLSPGQSREEALSKVLVAVEEAASSEASIICFPECYVPGYRIGAPQMASPDVHWLEEAWSRVDAKAAEGKIWVILGTERVEGERPIISTRISSPDGTLAGFQDKVQLDPSEESTYGGGAQRHVFQGDGFCFGIVICHEGWRYPETVRAAARNGAHIVFHPHFELVDNADYVPNQFADPSNSFHEKAALCRAAENTCYFATVNCALPGACTTSAVVDPDGQLLAYQPYGKEGLLLCELETEKATRLLAQRYKPI